MHYCRQRSLPFKRRIFASLSSCLYLSRQISRMSRQSSFLCAAHQTVKYESFHFATTGRFCSLQSNSTWREFELTNTLFSNARQRHARNGYRIYALVSRNGARRHQESSFFICDSQVHHVRYCGHFRPAKAGSNVRRLPAFCALLYYAFSSF